MASVTLRLSGKRKWIQNNSPEIRHTDTKAAVIDYLLNDCTIVSGELTPEDIESNLEEAFLELERRRKSRGITSDDQLRRNPPLWRAYERVGALVRKENEDANV